MSRQTTTSKWVAITPKGDIYLPSIHRYQQGAWMMICGLKDRPRYKAEGWRVKRCTITVDVD